MIRTPTSGATPSDAEIRLCRPADGDAEYRGVLALASRSRNTVGFLPDSAFAERAQQGTLIAALRSEMVIGYILYDLPRDEIRIVHLVVAGEHRRGGVARKLVETVAKDHRERRGIVLHCRNDFPADDLWPKLDFVPMGERPGRSFDGKPLTRWFRSFGQPDLFRLLHETDTRPIATMDACTFIDLADPAPTDVAQQLRADWLSEHVRLAVTDQLVVELHEGSDADERKRQIARTHEYRIPAPPDARWRDIYRQLLDAHPDAPKKDHDDLRHIAQSIDAQATWLITTDKAFVRRYGATAALVGGLRLVTPASFLRDVDEQARGDRYRPIELSGTEVTLRAVDGSTLPSLAGLFVNHQTGERIRELQVAIDRGAAHTAAVQLEIIEVDSQPRGLICWRAGERSLDVLLMRATAGRVMSVEVV